MFKVVFNNCYGGFSLSLKAVEWLEDNSKDNELRNFIKTLRTTNKEYPGVTKNERLCYDVSCWFEDKRHHKDLIAVVEALGNDVNGPCTTLDIVTIPGKQYRIEKYDGAEEVVTPEDSDWITIE